MEFKGKRVAFLGDSITEGVGVADLANRYDNRLLRLCGLSAVYNYGISGTRFAHQSAPSGTPRYDLCFCGRAYDIDKSADAVVVFGGTNDYGHGDAPLGTPEDKTPATFYGATRFLMERLRADFPEKPIVFLAPARRQGDELPRSEGKCALLDYVEAIRAVGAELHIPVIDLYRTLGIDPNREEDRARYAPDGLHFNDEGHAALAVRVKELFDSL